ncbi:MAG: PAS domain S-box protein [Syntrophomonadaceae bacterium]|nr:PAS domain S-box protein [Syntrophomonadaceae bacterium]
MENSGFSSDYSESIQQKLLFHHNLLEAVNDSIVVAGIDGKIIYWNKGSKWLFGWSDEEIIGQPFSILFGDNIREIPTHINEVYAGFWTGRIPIFTKNGRKKYVNASVSAMNNHLNKPSYLVAIISDVTELINSRIEAEEALRSKEEFLTVISHEIRTPMTGIIGYVELLGDLIDNSKQENYLNAIKENADNLLELFNDILDLSKIDANKIVVEQNVLNLKDIVQSVIKICMPTICAKNLELIVDIDPKLPTEIISDSIRIKQILNNLLSNAVKFTHQGKINIIVKKGQLLSKHKFQLIIEVSDTGIGIPSNKQTLVFEPFTQVDSSTTRKYGGTGLGLTIVKKLVNILEGELSLESEEGIGSTFKLTIPVQEVFSSYDDITSNQVIENYKHKILLISASSYLYNLLSSNLCAINAKLIWSENDKRLASIISFHEPKILIMDDINILKKYSLEAQDKTDFSPDKIYLLTNQGQYPDITSFQNMAEIKLVNSLDFLINELMFNFATESKSTYEEAKNILLICENQLNCFLIKNIIEQENYKVTDIPNIEKLTELSINNFNLVLLDTDLIEKNAEKLTNKLDNINYQTLIGLVNNHDNLNNLVFNDYIYKPITSDNLLALIRKHLGGM